MAKALVTGSSIAGPAVAWALRRAGFDVVVQERATQLRTAGQNIDIRDAGHDVLRAMGLHEAVADATTGEVGTRFLGPDGRVSAELGVREGHDGATAELEILRGDLSSLLVDLTTDDVEHRFDDHVVEVRQDGAGVDVRLEHRGWERYDLLVVAEGRGAHTRDLVWGDDVRYRSRDQYLAYGTIDRTDADDDWWNWLSATDHRMVGLRPDPQGTIRANLGFLAPNLGLERLGVEEQLAVLRARFDGVGWETERVLDGFAKRPEEFYLERNDQVVLPDYSRGRVVVLGDAAWAGGPTGMGTTLALVAAYVLGGELAAAEVASGADPRPALAAYERLLRPYAETVQSVPRLAYRLNLPRTRAGLRVLAAAQGIASRGLVRDVVEKVALSRRGRTFDLPSYEIYAG